jgi:predicted Ser/Thr protein kinase
MNQASLSTHEHVRALSKAVADEFASTRRIMTFEEWLGAALGDPTVHLRNAAQYVRDALDHFGRREVRTPSGKVSRFCLFDREYDGGNRLVGQEASQNEFYEAVDGFCRVGRIDRLILLTGPNGSAKSTLLECLQAGLEAYSKTERGAQYRFSWVFPTKHATGGSIGFAVKEEAFAERTSFATLGSESLDARLIDETKDHPIFLLPLSQRKRFLEEALRDHKDFVVSQSIANGDLSTRNRKIFDALLATYNGDFDKVMQHVQIERFFLSRNYRTAIVDVEPKQTVDARSYPVTGDRAFAQLPPSVSGQVLYAAQGDLVDANRGIIVFSDLLKRPYEHYKYLLTATEGGKVALDHVLLNLDVVLAGSANDINLLEFRATRSTEYQSFRARLSPINVPYLLDYRVERRIYQEQVGNLLRGIQIAPHVSRILALWGVMTRLRRPDAELYSAKISRVLRKITPVEKADLYAYGRVPSGLSSEEARELLAAVPSLHEERYPYAVVKADGSEHILGDYEGSFGASVRDLKNVLLAAASEPGVRVVTVPRVFEQLRRFMADASNHRWMMLEASGTGYHLLDSDNDKSITAAAWNCWLDLSDWEVRHALGLVDEERYVELFRKYMIHAKHHIKHERIFDAVTGKLTDPDEKFMKELERAMDPQAGATFRQEVFGRVGAWALSHPNEEPIYPKIFPDYFSRLRDDYYRQQKDTVAKGIQFLLEVLREEDRNSQLELSAQEKERSRAAIARLLQPNASERTKEHHTKESLIEMLVALSKYRY